MGKSYNNTLTSHECSLGIERFFVGLYPTTFTATRVDVSSPPSGFMDLGAVVEDTPSVRISREVYSLSTGMPKVVQYESIVAVGAEIGFSLYTNSWWQAQFALGNATIITTVTTIASGAVSTAYFGKATIRNFALLGVCDFANGAQIIHEFPKVSPAGDWEEALRPGEVNQMPFSFNALGFIDTIDSCKHLIVGKRHYVNGDGVLCTF